MSPIDDPLIVRVFLLKGRSRERQDVVWGTYLVTMDMVDLESVKKSLDEVGMETLVSTHFLRVPECVACGEPLLCGQGDHDCPEARFFGPSDEAEYPSMRSRTQAEVDAHEAAAIDAAIAVARTESDEGTIVRRPRRAEFGTKIVAAAVKKGEEVYSLPPPARHHDILQHMATLGLKQEADDTQGFLTDLGRFVRRKPAFYIAEAAGQLIRPKQGGYQGDELYSEDLW